MNFYILKILAILLLRNHFSQGLIMHISQNMLYLTIVSYGSNALFSNFNSIGLGI